MSLPAQIARTRRFSLGVPGQFTVGPDGAEVLFLRTRAGDDPAACLWALDPDSGTERLLADPAQLLAAGSAEPGGPAGTAGPAGPAGPGTGIDAYAVDQASRLAAFALAGGLWTVDVAGGAARRLPARSPVADPRPDPAGRPAHRLRLRRRAAGDRGGRDRGPGDRRGGPARRHVRDR
jgi:dipeptidyl-peptidase 4